MYTWPWRRFEACFKRHLGRKAAGELTNQRDLMLAALSANSNMDMPENQEALRRKIDAINEGWRRGVEILYGARDATVEDDSFDDDPLFRHIRDQGSSMRTSVVAPEPSETGMGQRWLAGATA